MRILKGIELESPPIMSDMLRDKSTMSENVNKHRGTQNIFLNNMDMTELDSLLPKSRIAIKYPFNNKKMKINMNSNISKNNPI